MITAIETAVGFVGLWVVAAVAAHLLHLIAGVLAVGVADVRRQTVEFYAVYGPIWYAVFVLTAGIYQRYEVDLEPEIVDYPGGDEL